MNTQENNGQHHKKALMCATVASMIGQFNMANIQILLELGYEVHVACNFDDRSVWTEERVDEFRNQLNGLGVKYFQIDFARSPKHIGMVSKGYNEIKELLFREKYTLVHVHTPVAAAEVRLAAKDFNDAVERRIKEGKRAPERLRVIYTAHGFHFYEGAPKKNWLLFYPVEKWLSSYTDILITINHEDYERARREFHAKKTVYVPGVGVDVKRFAGVSESIDREKKREELGVEKNDILLLSVGELNSNKNHSVVIKALAELQSSGAVQDHIIYMIAGTGDKKEELETLGTEEGVDLRLLGFRNDVSELLTIADLYILPSLREGLNVSLMEAMASGTPCLCGNIRGNVDLVNEDKGGELFDPSSTPSVAEAINKELEERLQWPQQSSYNQEKIKHFDLSVVEKAYENLVGGGIEQTEEFAYSFEAGLELIDYKYLVEVLNRQKLRSGLGVNNDDYLLISVGELSPRKNQIVVLKALSSIKQYNPELATRIKYIIVGQGALEESYKEFIQSHSLESCVQLLGFSSDIPDLLHASDLFVFPSHQEGLPVALMEAMSSGIDVVCSRIRGNTDLVDNGLFEAEDEERLKKLITEKAEHRGEKNRNPEIMQNFRIETVQQKMKEIYETVQINKGY